MAAERHMVLPSLFSVSCSTESLLAIVFPCWRVAAKRHHSVSVVIDEDKTHVKYRCYLVSSWSVGR